MLPDLRVVVIAVISTFLLTVSIAFYTSARLGQEPRKSRPESLAAFDDSPVNRIALNWPEPVQPPAPPLDLDFAVSAKSLRNPVREVANETGAMPAPNEPVPPAPQKEEREEPPAKPEMQATAPAVLPDPVPDPVVTATIPAPSAKEEPASSAEPEPAERIASRSADDPAAAAPPRESEVEKEPPAKRRAAKKAKSAKAAKSEPAKPKTPRARPRAATAAGAANRSGFPFNFLGTSFPN